MSETSCHCENVKLIFDELPDSITICNCSICHRLGAQWGYYNQSQVAIEVSDSPTETYLWGEKTMTFHRCAQCGCTTHYTRTKNDGEKIIAVNFRMAAASDIESVPIRHFDGAVKWEYIE